MVRFNAPYLWYFDRKATCPFVIPTERSEWMNPASTE
jgi:hypothetical protein